MLRHALAANWPMLATHRFCRKDAFGWCRESVTQSFSASRRRCLPSLMAWSSASRSSSCFVRVFVGTSTAPWLWISGLRTTMDPRDETRPRATISPGITWAGNGSTVRIGTSWAVLCLDAAHASVYLGRLEPIAAMLSAPPLHDSPVCAAHAHARSAAEPGACAVPRVAAALVCTTTKTLLMAALLRDQEASYASRSSSSAVDSAWTLLRRFPRVVLKVTGASSESAIGRLESSCARGAQLSRPASVTKASSESTIGRLESSCARGAQLSRPASRRCMYEPTDDC
jgi:hypothetical protein